MKWLDVAGRDLGSLEQRAVVHFGGTQIAGYQRVKLVDLGKSDTASQLTKCPFTMTTLGG